MNWISSSLAPLPEGEHSNFSTGELRRDRYGSLTSFQKRRQRSQGGTKLIVSLLIGSLLLSGCADLLSSAAESQSRPLSSAAALSTPDLLRQSWQAYAQRFIQADGRVIDREHQDRTTSEGQAYALLRSVLINDRATFDRVLQWSENNLQRRKPDGTRSDQLWSWRWGRDDQGNWTILDTNFASDADLDAITALILAAQRWQQPTYAQLAEAKLQDLWNLATVTVTGEAPAGAAGNTSTRYFLPGPKQVFQPQPTQLYLNPSYLAPYAFRLFAQVDPAHDWLSLVDSSYDVLNQSAGLSQINLPSNWVVLDTTTGTFQPMNQSSSLQSIYSFDAYRVWWRVAWDATWFNEPRAERYLQKSLPPFATQWRSKQTIPAQIDLQGKALVNYESTAQYAMLYQAFLVTTPDLANQIRQQKLLPTYENGFWDNDSAYYAQNLSWFGLFPLTEIDRRWLNP
jgi:endoglucanase